MISNENTFTTKKMITDKEVTAKPAPELDERLRQYHLVRDNDIKKYKNEYIRSEAMLLKRKFKKIKQAGAK